MNKTEKVIQRVNRYLSLVRYNYSSQEKLSRLHIINDYYNSINNKATEETLTTTFEMAEELTKELKLPLKVRGVFLTEGRPKRKFYTVEQLELSVGNPLNQRFPLCYDHKNKEVEKIIGVVTKIWYDKSIKGLRWQGRINNETAARNIIDKVIKEVSVTVFSVSDYDDNYGLAGKNLTFKELSVVWDGSEPNNSIEPYT